MTDRGVGVADTAAGAGVAEVRTRERSIGGNTYAEQYVIPIQERVASFKGVATSFRTAGLASTNHIIFSIENASGSTILLAVKRLSLQVEDTGVLTTVAPVCRTYRSTTASASGTTLTKSGFDTSLSSSASVVVRGATASDGGAATAITNGGTLSPAWTQFKMRAATAVGQYLFDDEPMIPLLCADDPIILRAAQALVVRMEQASVTTASYIVNVAFEEFTLP